MHAKIMPQKTKQRPTIGKSSLKQLDGLQLFPRWRAVTFPLARE